MVDTVYDVPWPGFFRDAISVLAVATGDIFKLGGVSCFAEANYYDTLLFSTLAPLGLMAVLGLLGRFLPTDKHRAYAVKGASYTLILTYPSIALVTLRLFLCREVGDASYLQADYTVQCYTAEWSGYAAYAAIVIALVPLGYPLAMAVALYKYRAQLQTPFFEDRIGHLYNNFTDDRYYWELVETVRKLLLTSVVVYFGDGSVRLVMGALVCVVAHLVHTGVQPYRYEQYNFLQHCALGATWLTLLLGLLVRSVELDGAAGQEPGDSANVGVLLIEFQCFFNGELSLSTVETCVFFAHEYPSKAAVLGALVLVLNIAVVLLAIGVLMGYVAVGKFKAQQMQRRRMMAADNNLDLDQQEEGEAGEEQATGVGGKGENADTRGTPSASKRDSSASDEHAAWENNPGVEMTEMARA